jgi:hypothetical protein
MFLSTEKHVFSDDFSLSTPLDLRCTKTEHQYTRKLYMFVEIVI